MGRAGNILILVALAAVPLIGMVALAIDFGRTSLVKGKLDLAADEAALLATTAASNAWKAGDVNALAEAKAAATARFKAQTANQSAVTINPPNVVLTQVGGLFSATVSYTAQTTTTFAQVLGVTTLPIGGQSSASLSLNPYVDIQILMDVSSSMTLAATPAAMLQVKTLVANWPANKTVVGDASKGCTLACHWDPKDDYYIRAVQQGIQLRITVLQTAVTNLINTLVGLNANSRFRLGLYSFNTQLNIIYPPGSQYVSADIAGALGSIPGIAPAIICKTCKEPETFFTQAMASLSKLVLPAPQQANTIPQRFLFIVTDGVYDQTTAMRASKYCNNDPGRSCGPFDPADCAAMKALGVSILLLYTPYMAPDPTNTYYVQNVLPFAPQIVPALQACASGPTYYFVANDAAEINAQLQNMLQLVIQTSSHLTN